MLHDLTMEELKSMSPLFEEDIMDALKIENCVKNRERFYYLTNDYKGERILSVVCDADLDNRLRAILMSDLKERDNGQIIENDASEQDGTPVLFGFYCDLPRIKRFDTALSLREKRGVIICFDFQRPALEKYCCEYIT